MAWAVAVKGWAEAGKAVRRSTTTEGVLIRNRFILVPICCSCGAFTYNFHLEEGGMASQDQFLRAILATVARQTFSPDFIFDTVAGSGDKGKQLRAYNLCDGTRSQAEIGKELKLDPSNFSKTLNRWIDSGIVIRVGEGRDTKPLHVYPLPETALNKRGKKDGK